MRKAAAPDIDTFTIPAHFDDPHAFDSFVKIRLDHSTIAIVANARSRKIGTPINGLSLDAHCSSETTTSYFKRMTHWHCNPSWFV
ncbi:hypothetical protein WT56_14360 [Burkholderia pseudomultivorans]|uniref:Uncharacterized protein n=1 Tax=Burkholderia pseudomultivorans TaxID=1207504 RepID=A0A132EHF5_9BURK|nr:hypothetical protein WT56_14360 [Burkholderia pseudomultivorans]